MCVNNHIYFDSRDKLLKLKIENIKLKKELVLISNSNNKQLLEQSITLDISQRMFIVFLASMFNQRQDIFLDVLFQKFEQRINQFKIL